MKKIILLLCVISFLSCKNDSKTETLEVSADGPEKTAKQNDGLTLMQGEFIYFADAAVLQMNNAVYGVVINDKVKELHKQSKTYKKETTDGVLVQVRGKITPKPANEEGWPFNVEIKEIVSIKALEENKTEVIKLGTK